MLYLSRDEASYSFVFTDGDEKVCIARLTASASSCGVTARSQARTAAAGLPFHTHDANAVAAEVSLFNSGELASRAPRVAAESGLPGDVRHAGQQERLRSSRRTPSVGADRDAVWSPRGGAAHGCRGRRRRRRPRRLRPCPQTTPSGIASRPRPSASTRSSTTSATASTTAATPCQTSAAAASERRAPRASRVTSRGISALP